MPWTFKFSKESNHAPPPEGVVSLSFEFQDDDGARKSILVYLPIGYSEEQLTNAIFETKEHLDAGEL